MNEEPTPGKWKPRTLMEVIIDYEIRSSWWASWISNDWLQRVSANWFAWKVRRKFARWQRMRGDLIQIQ